MRWKRLFDYLNVFILASSLEPIAWAISSFRIPMQNLVAVQPCSKVALLDMHASPPPHFSTECRLIFTRRTYLGQSSDPDQTFKKITGRAFIQIKIGSGSDLINIEKKDNSCQNWVKLKYYDISVSRFFMTFFQDVLSTSSSKTTSEKPAGSLRSSARKSSLKPSTATPRPS